MRDPDGWTYFKEEVGGLVVGGFEPEAKPWRSPDDLPYPFEFQLLEEDWEHFSVLMDEALLRIPALAETGIRKFYNGPESFTPDNQFLLGEAPELRASSSAPASTPSASPPPAAPGGRSRSGSSRGSRRRPGRRRRAPVRAVPRRQPLAARPGRGGARPALRRALAQPRARRPPATSGARRCTTGWPPRARSSAPGWAGSGPTCSRPPAGAALDYSWGKPAWLPWSAAEQRATREAVAVFDQTSFSKYVVAGPRRAARRCSGSARPTSTSRSGDSSTRRCSTGAAPTSPT